MRICKQYTSMIYDFVFVVLVYRNTKDLKEFFESLKISNSKVVVVNSFYDEETKTAFQSIAEQNNADFINVENKGYGYGNNRGCEYALKNYDFKYLIISNADIEIQKLDIAQLSDNQITAPEIITLKGKKQNPYRPYNIPFIDKMQYFGYNHQLKLPVFFIIAINKIARIFFRLFHLHGKIYSAHGAFIIIPNALLKRVLPIYNEKMFLFAEEEHFAKVMHKNGFDIYFDSSIVIKHKEDGSTSGLNVFEHTRNSFLEYYKTWYTKQ